MEEENWGWIVLTGVHMENRRSNGAGGFVSVNIERHKLVCWSDSRVCRVYTNFTKVVELAYMCSRWWRIARIHPVHGRVAFTDLVSSLAPVTFVGFLLQLIRMRIFTTLDQNVFRHDISVKFNNQPDMTTNNFARMDLVFGIPSISWKWMKIVIPPALQ